MILTQLDVDDLDSLLIIFETLDWNYLSEITETDIPLLYDKLTEMRDQI